MTRGWERKAGAGEPHEPQKAERATLHVARIRALADLQQACAPAHRAMLEAVIRDLDAKIRAV